ncbi:cupin domain-containing protein [Bacillus carboniphilus]|uniref:Cupin domain-containing protein n=1 Tax=Bacillus carboniphilus TaxID=86663 RepID=A0ABY9JT39_9BACI|nr:cupin domain-containing protein [Bacillus carboniphilus]WLR42544.1 cupin domain-containing protein [Bacillus carboniphilus]
MKKKTKDNSEEFRIGTIFKGWHLLNHDQLSIIHEQMSPNCEEELHDHEKAEQFFFVLKGTLTCKVDGIEHILRENEGIHVPPKMKHKMINYTNDSVEFLTISSPHYRL